MSVLLNPTCPSDCTDLPAIEKNLCAPEYHYGQIKTFYLAAADAADFTNVEDLAEWTTRLSDSDTITGDEIRELPVIAELPEPEQNEIATSWDRIAVGLKQFSIPFNVDETNDVNYNWLLTLECNLTFKLWYETFDGMLYGGNEGIVVTLRANQVIPLESTDLTKFVGTAKWKSQFSPLRCVSPMA
jgi:hypothetical protein